MRGTLSHAEHESVFPEKYRMAVVTALGAILTGLLRWLAK
jgi:hypothetical protein